ncbi:CDP-alcohol phosphatidyltransferase family protein [Actinoplanes sp. TBRC 11911]|uniref:CDP-alcohol phosphatidyltransferase family protein n=1 Tax=Actinoplanes sp. TBRC 11911 TaxID=2729386 RepID=UPI00145C7B56|nr:CDP-alcohol phosphatidyltransferase family protein [Actinoplanes sp. TBRC 11911]NMO53321.1 CDP-alcohol phosphatidyltransferase family protein [Actinoplanes sp. TBRC 11911]
MKVSLPEIRERTYKPVDAWWTVLLVDPLASRLVRVVAPHKRITPNLLTVIATLIGLVAAAFFAQGSRWWLVVGAVLFHLSFVVDCMDGKIARLNGTGSLFGQWLDYVFDRVRVLACAFALMGGQYARTHQLIYLYLAAVVIFLDMFRYLNSLEMSKIRRGMKDQIAEFKQPLDDTVRLSRADEGDEPEASPKRRLGRWLRARRIRTHLFSGIEYHMGVFIIGPLTGLIIPVTIVSGALLVAFECFLIYKFWRATRAFPSRLTAAKNEYYARQIPEEAVI